MNQTVIGVFNSRVEAERAREQLVSQGFAESDISVQSNPADIDAAAAPSARSSATNAADEGFMASVSRFFSDLFGDGASDDAGYYSEAVRRGSAVVSLQVSDESQATRAQHALAAAGAVNIDAMAESWRQEGYSSFDASAKPFNAEEIATQRARVMPVVKEELEVGKREVDIGTVRVHTRVVETPVNETVQLSEQHAQIERRPVDRPATQADLEAFQGGSVEVHETAERAVVSKSARVVEEVLVGTATSTSEQAIEDSVRNTVVEVDRSDAARSGRADQPSRAGAGTTGAGTTGAGMSQAEGASQNAATTALGNDAMFRSHFQQTYASGGESYDTYAPAYDYGAALRRDQRYAGSDWTTVEANAERDWQSRNPGTAWEKVKSAVRHGWDSMTS